MLSHLLSFLLALSQQVNENTSGLKFLLGTAGIATLFAMLKEMSKKGKTGKQKMSKAQRKEMRKLRWKMIMGVFKRKRSYGGGKGIDILLVLLLILIVGGLFALVGWKIALFLLVGVPLLYLLVRDKENDNTN